MDHGLIHYKQMAVFGTMGACKRHFGEVLELLARKTFNIGAYITELPLERINEGIDLAERGDVLKVVLIP
jgi:Zn-dependent alcohol dehydrogenase